ncbi:TPA: Low copy number virion structural protein [Clostridioides difficile]|nr:Low copy number virion structural protein [Clostridioides difficile]
MKESDFARYTEKIRSMLPFWFEMKKNPNKSIGIEFLNIFGMELDEIEEILLYASKQIYIESADEDFVDLVYKVLLPSNFNINNISMVYTNQLILERSWDLYTFFGIKKNEKNLENNISQPDYYFIDEKKKVIYVRESYDKEEDLPFGKIKVKCNNKEFLFELNLHHVWNFFDEFGSLVGCSRLKGEKNHEYKLRILDVFKNPANSTKRGLANGISRELGIREVKEWKDMSKDFVISEKMVLVNTILVDNNLITLDDVYITSTGEILLKGNPDKKNQSAVVSFIKSLEMYELVDINNKKLSIELYNSDATPTKLLIDYVTKIKEDTSIFWNDFKYDENIWVREDENYDNSFSFLPTFLDSNIKGFSKYGYYKK